MPFFGAFHTCMLVRTLTHGCHGSSGGKICVAYQFNQRAIRISLENRNQIAILCAPKPKHPVSSHSNFQRPHSTWGGGRSIPINLMIDDVHINSQTHTPHAVECNGCKRVRAAEITYFPYNIKMFASQLPYGHQP